MVTTDPPNIPLSYELQPGKITIDAVFGVNDPPAKIESNQVETLANDWIESFNQFISHEVQEFEQIESAVDSLFMPKAVWNDHLALEWNYRSITGRNAISQYLFRNLKSSGLGNFELDTSSGLCPSVMSPDENVEWIRALLKFQINGAVGSAMVLLVRVPGKEDGVAALLIYSEVEDINGYEPKINKTRDFSPRNLTPGRVYDHEKEPATDPSVVIIGGGHGGLCLAAHLMVRGVECLVVEKDARIGDVWRNRYDFLRLWLPSALCELPYLAYPENMPQYIPKQKFADWLEFYSKTLDLNVCTESTVDNVVYDEKKQIWTVSVVKSDKYVKILHPAHVVMASGYLGKGRPIEFPDMEKFAGEIVDYSTYKNGRRFKGQNVVVIGAGQTAHDLAQDLCEQGAHKVTMVQRVS
jgi:hypothetical protein